MVESVLWSVMLLVERSNNSLHCGKEDDNDNDQPTRWGEQIFLRAGQAEFNDITTKNRQLTFSLAGRASAKVQSRESSIDKKNAHSASHEYGCARNAMIHHRHEANDTCVEQHP
jgi:hypothetical protein